MDQLIKQLKEFTSESLSYKNLGELVKKISVDDLQYRHLLPPLTDTINYTRNILLLEPLECVLLHWPAGVSSAIHYHKGFWGYVLILEGKAENIEYKYEHNQLIETHEIVAGPGGVLNEPDGVIHKIVNADKEKPLVSLHFYYPALETLDGLTLYDEETGTIGVLNEKARSASFNEAPEHFKTQEQGVFEFVPFHRNPKARSHRINPVIPKPDPQEIKNMLSDYYSEQAQYYDMFDLNHASRRNYTEKLNEIITTELNNRASVDSYLALACGTARRAISIREACRHDYTITGVDLCAEMCDLGEQRGIEIYAYDWLAADLGERRFDVITFLYAFGHIPNEEERMAALKKVYEHLEEGGAFFFDVFNINDKNEWGPRALAIYEKNQLRDYGYQRGDVFYRKSEGKEIAFLHYFDEDELVNQLEKIGFRIEFIKHIGYVNRSGEEFTEKEQGSLFIKAVK